LGCQFLNRSIFGALVLASVGLIFPSPVSSEVRIVKKTTHTQKATTQKTVSPKAERSPASREQNLQLRYVLEHRETKRVVTFHESSIDEVVDGLNSADISVDKWHSCSTASASSGEDIETIEKFLDMELLIDSLAKIPSPELNDAQREWVRTLSPCQPEMRLHLKALALILGNYKLIKKPNDA
jgi:hypothetical protein